MQNIPVRTEIGSSNLRKFFRAGDGEMLVDADYSQIPSCGCWPTSPKIKT